jgi:hypothetical protein
MNYEYSNVPYRDDVYIRLKNNRHYYRCEYYDGIRILSSSIPVGKHRYESRHLDYDICDPVSIAPEGKLVIVNFCGTIVSDFPIPIDEEKRVMAIFYKGDHPYSHAKSKRYPIIGEIDSKNKSM